MQQRCKDISFVFRNAATASPGVGMWLDAVFWGAVKQAANDTPCHHSKAARVTHANPGNALVGHRVIVTVPGNLSRVNTTIFFFFMSCSPQRPKAPRQAQTSRKELHLSHSGCGSDVGGWRGNNLQLSGLSKAKCSISLLYINTLFLSLSVCLSVSPFLSA